MSIKRVRICDRCGAEFDLKDSVLTFLSYGKFISIKQIKDQVLSENDLDLCDECLEKFNRFMSMEIDS